MEQSKFEKFKKDLTKLLNENDYSYRENAKNLETQFNFASLGQIPSLNEIHIDGTVSLDITLETGDDLLIVYEYKTLKQLLSPFREESFKTKFDKIFKDYLDSLNLEPLPQSQRSKIELLEKTKMLEYISTQFFYKMLRYDLNNSLQFKVSAHYPKFLLKEIKFSKLLAEGISVKLFLVSSDYDETDPTKPEGHFKELNHFASHKEIFDSLNSFYDKDKESIDELASTFNKVKNQVEKLKLKIVQLSKIENSTK